VYTCKKQTQQSITKTAFKQENENGLF